MKTNMTHKILVAISKEANKQGYTTTLIYEYDDWWLEIGRDNKRVRLIDRDTKISDLEEWMES
ncbi:MAG: hypothetical protein GY829_08185 [Gammaproteobacteria bacterium]|nr:hypothetical protein [Gammaproteobacteria bacterium]